MKFFKVYLENENGDKICMTTDASHYMISSIDGLYPPTATLSTAGYAGADGSYLTNAYVDKRNIVITFYMSGVGDVEQRRQELYSVVQPSKYIKMYYYTRRRKVYAEGYVETMSISNFVSGVNGQISILCPDIYWHDIETYTVTTDTSGDSDVTGAFHYAFPNGDWYTGDDGYQETELGTIASEDTSTITNGYHTLKIPDVESEEVAITLKITNASDSAITFVYKASSDRSFSIGHGGELILTTSDFTLEAGYSIVITTYTGQKDIRLYDTNGKDQGSLIGKLVWEELTWFTIDRGDNTYTFYFVTDEGISKSDLVFEITYQPAYLGV